VPLPVAPRASDDNMFSKPAIQPSCFNSRLLPDLFDLKQLGEGAPIRVADFGPANGDTIKFLSQFNCRLFVIDIKEDFTRINGEVENAEDIGDEQILAMFKAALRQLSDTQVDICLFWDMFNYLEPRVLGLFLQALAPHLSARFRGHGFAVLNKGTPLHEQTYGIINSELLSTQSRGRGELPHRHSQSVINGATPGIAVRQGVLREDGRLEILLHKG